MAVRDAEGGDPRPGYEEGGVPQSRPCALDDMTAQSRILIIDYGSQFTQLIARRVREARVYSEIHPPTRSAQWIREWNPTGIIFSGGPNSVYGENAPLADLAVLDVAPVLGVCYGMQMIAYMLGAEVTRGGQ